MAQKLVKRFFFFATSSRGAEEGAGSGSTLRRRGLAKALGSPSFPHTALLSEELHVKGQNSQPAALWLDRGLLSDYIYHV